MIKELIDEPLDLDSDDGSYQHAAYSQPNYKDLSSASKALVIAIGGFFDSCMDVNYGE